MSTAKAEMSKLADLAKVSKELNAKSDEVNQILQDLEKKLVAFNFGVESWVSDSLVEQHGRNEDGTRWSRETELGFGRYGDRPQLLVREVSYIGEEDQPGSGYVIWDVTQESQPRPLLQAPRDLRIRALNRIENLIDTLIGQSKRIMSTIDEGRKTVDNL